MPSSPSRGNRGGIGRSSGTAPATRAVSLGTALRRAVVLPGVRAGRRAVVVPALVAVTRRPRRHRTIFRAAPTTRTIGFRTTLRRAVMTPCLRAGHAVGAAGATARRRRTVALPVPPTIARRRWRHRAIFRAAATTRTIGLGTTLRQTVVLPGMGPGRRARLIPTLAPVRRRAGRLGHRPRAQGCKPQQNRQRRYGPNVT